MNPRPVEPIYSRYVLGVFDMVGQSNIFQSFPESEAAPGSLLAQTVTNSLGFIQWFRTSFEKAFIETPFEKNPLAPYDRDLGKIEKLLSIDTLKSQAFSDLFVPYTRAPETHQHIPALGLIYRMLHASATMTALTLGAGRALRGGIDIGGAVERLPGEIYGRALNDAMQLTMREADYPRVLIGQNLRTYLAQFSQGVEGNVFAKHARDLSAKCLKFMAEDTDRRTMLHYLGQALPAVTPETFQQAQLFIQQQKATWTSMGSPHVAAKYDRLAAYWRRFRNS